jgi:serine/threonine protein kinase
LLGILQVVHQQGVIHRDLKPYNIMRRKSDRKLVLIDFGISKQLEANPATGTSIGSLGYSPLEQFWGGKAYPSSDLYSLGVTAFYLMSGISPHQILAIEMEKTSPAHAHNWTAHWRKYVEHPVSDNLGAVLDKLMQIDHKQRYQSASEVLADLNGAPQLYAKTKVQPDLIHQNSPHLANTLAVSVPPVKSIGTNVKLLMGGSVGLIGLALVLMLATGKPTQPIGSASNVSKDLGDRTENAYAYLARGNLAIDLGNKNQALADFNTAIKLDNRSSYAYMSRADLYGSQGKREQAIADYDRAIVLDPSSFYQYYQRGILHQELNHKAKAQADFIKTIELAKKADQEKEYADAAVRLQQLKPSNQSGDIF